MNAITGPIGAFFSGIALKVGLWMLDRGLAAIINSAASDETEDKIATIFDSKIDTIQNLEPNAGAAARARLVSFADKLKAKLLAP